MMLTAWSCFTQLQIDFLPVWLVLDYVSDFLYILDTAIKFHTGYMEQGILITDRKQIYIRYMKTSQFVTDIVSLLPTDFLYLKIGVNVPIVRINRFLRITRQFEAFDRIETRTSYPNIFRICKLMLYVFIVIHWNACFYFALSEYIGFGNDEWVYPSTSDPGFATHIRKYVFSFYFCTLILTTVGDVPGPVREEEYLFMVVEFLIAVLVFATIMGSTSSVIMNINNADAAFYPNHDLVKAYMKQQKLNKQLESRVNAWYQHLHINKKMTNENQILQHLPDRLRAEVAVNVHLQTLSKVQLFQNCEISLLEQLILKLKPQIYSPGEYVCKKGDVGREMYFIKEGKLAVVGDDGVTEYAVLGEGHFFGEISILNIKGSKSGNRRTANIKSIGYSDLFCLSKEDMTDVLIEFPDAKTIMEEKGKQILRKMNMLDEEAAAAADQRWEEMKKNLERMEAALTTLQTKFARLVAELESNTVKLKYRLQSLENETEGWLVSDDDDTDGGFSA
ncbi:cyclic nucleotide-gated cation channel alpha-4 [Protopterus annectens]|uniref:cyclic nucleotide-gated cation channel alpha-4 n=1 Tax=Protopterus annectens TaxID=7888 RepID=UPI001CFB3507|nr:cyclic nucleotide-gated cation channel alpha-4 [Protopterus annectens]